MSNRPAPPVMRTCVQSLCMETLFFLNVSCMQFVQLQTCTPCHAHLQIELWSIALLENTCFGSFVCFFVCFSFCMFLVCKFAVAKLHLQAMMDIQIKPFTT